jgi:hypothetical protein
LYRRHTGSQDGVGQSQWDPEGKSFFLLRTGKASIGLGETIETALKTEQLIPESAELPWSNLERLMSSEPIRKRAGISFSNGTLTYLTDKTANLRTLQKIAQDFSSHSGNRKKALDDIWNNEKKHKYFDELKTAGFAIDVGPNARTTATSPIGAASSSMIARSVSRGRAPKDKRLIANSDDNPFVNQPDLGRAEKIWRELQFTLEFEKHDNAIAVLMRVLPELSITHYARQQGLVSGASDSFSRRVSAVADSMLNRGFFDKKARSIIAKFESDKPIASAHSMHQYVHNPNSPGQLRHESNLDRN